jgi:hypothetical protein
MKRNTLLVMVGLGILIMTGCEAFASDDDLWTDYDPCGWSVEEETDTVQIVAASIEDDGWSDYDPCGWNVEEEGEQFEVVKAFIADDELTDYAN